MEQSYKIFLSKLSPPYPPFLPSPNHSEDRWLKGIFNSYWIFGDTGIFISRLVSIFLSVLTRLTLSQFSRVILHRFLHFQVLGLARCVYFAPLLFALVFVPSATFYSLRKIPDLFRWIFPRVSDDFSSRFGPRSAFSILLHFFIYINQHLATFSGSDSLIPRNFIVCHFHASTNLFGSIQFSVYPIQFSTSFSDFIFIIALSNG